MVETETKDSTSCSFCLRPSDAVDRLVAGPGVFICNDCVALCAQIIQDPPVMPEPLQHWDDSLDREQVLSTLPRIAATGAQAERNLAHYVQKARGLGATWAAIGAALGMTRQSAWERFSGEE